MMKKTRKVILTAGLLLTTTFGFAQTQTLEGIKKLHRSAISPIYEGSEVKGYLLFCKADKADKKNDNYTMEIYDQDLNRVKSIPMQKPRNAYALLQNTYNGSAFAFYFYNVKEKYLEIETYDKSLNKLASKKITNLSSMDTGIITQELSSNNSEESSSSNSMTLYPVENKGFIRNSFSGLGKGYKLEMFDNNLNLKWTYETPKNAKEYEQIAPMGVEDKYFLTTIARRPGMMSKKLTFNIAAFNVETGKKVIDKNIETSSKEQLSMSSFSYDKENKEFVAFGEFYKLDDKPMVDKSQGFFIKRLDETGKETASKFYSWEKDVKSKLPSAAKESVSSGFVNYTHNIIKGADGKTYIVAEQFKIVTNGAGIAVKALGGSASAMKGSIANLLIFVIEPSLALSEIRFYEKEKSNAYLPAGTGLMGTGILGHIIKSTGGFDYQFTQKTNDLSGFNLVYINYDKEKGEGTKKILGNITLGKEGTFTIDKIDVTSKATSSFLYPGKMGYLMMVDHIKKEDKLGMKLIKVNN